MLKKVLATIAIVALFGSAFVPVCANTDMMLAVSGYGSELRPCVSNSGTEAPVSGSVGHCCMAENADEYPAPAPCCDLTILTLTRHDAVVSDDAPCCEFLPSFTVLQPLAEGLDAFYEGFFTASFGALFFGSGPPPPALLQVFRL